MLRHFAYAARALVAALAAAVATAACGIKGPLTPAPKPEAAKDSAKVPAAAGVPGGSPSPARPGASP